MPDKTQRRKARRPASKHPDTLDEIPLKPVGVQLVFDDEEIMYDYVVLQSPPSPVSDVGLGVNASPAVTIDVGLGVDLDVDVMDEDAVVL